MDTPCWEGSHDMVEMGPAEDECVKSLLSVLRRGTFDVALDAVGNKFDLDGFTVTDIGPTFMSCFEHDPKCEQIHRDLPEAKGAFYKAVIPIHMPQGGASLCVADDDCERASPTQMRHDQGIALGGATCHGTGECDCREQRDVRLSVAVHLTDVNHDNVEHVAGDTSFWSTGGDADWHVTQQGKLWQRDGSQSLRDDVGRKPSNAENDRSDCQAMKHLCAADPTGFRLDRAKTRGACLEDDACCSTLETRKSTFGNAKAPVIAKEHTEQEPSCEMQVFENVISAKRQRKTARARVF
jgi:hypothetical protein